MAASGHRRTHRGAVENVHGETSLDVRLYGRTMKAIFEGESRIAGPLYRDGLSKNTIRMWSTSPAGKSDSRKPERRWTRRVFPSR